MKTLLHRMVGCLDLELVTALSIQKTTVNCSKIKPILRNIRRVFQISEEVALNSSNSLESSKHECNVEVDVSNHENPELIETFEPA